MQASIRELQGETKMVSIRGSDGQVRSFPIAGCRKAIEARTPIVRPGQNVNLTIYGGRVVVTRK